MNRQPPREADGASAKACSGGRLIATLLAVCLALTASSSLSSGQPASRLNSIVSAADPEVVAFYRGKPDGEIWLRDGRPTRAAVQAMARLAEARKDGLDETHYLRPELQQAWAAVQRGDRKPATVHVLDLLLSSAFMRFIEDMRRPPADMRVTNPARPLSTGAILTAVSEG